MQLDTDSNADSAFESLSTQQVPPHRRITQDDAPSMMPVAAVGSQVQGQGQVSHMQATGQAHLSQQLSHSHSNHSGKAGSAASFASVSGGGAPARKKARLG